MFRARRLVGWILAVLAGCFAAAVLAVNLYVQSQATQSRLQQELSQRLGMPLRIARISVTPWGGLRLSGITIPQADPNAATPFLDASSVRLRVRLQSIFRQPLIIKEIALIKPQVTWPQNAAGKWRVPSRALPPKNAERAPRPQRPAEHEIGIPEPEIRHVKVTDASFHFLDRQQRNVALFDGVQFSSTMRTGTSLHGTVRVAKISLRDRVFLTDVHAALDYDPAALELTAIQARAAKGELDGSFSLQPQAPDSPFIVRANFRAIHADELVAQAGGGKDTVRGILDGTLEATGKLGDATALTGSGVITLRGGHVKQFALLTMIGQLLQIEELSQLDLQQAEAHYRLAGTAVLIDQLSLRSPNLALGATGSANFNGKLALDSTLTINEKVRSQLFRGMRENFVATEQPGEYRLPFHIGGTLEKPKTDLMERAVGVDLKNIGGVIDALFGRGKSKKKNAEPSPEASPVPTATPLPSPTASLTPTP